MPAPEDMEAARRLPELAVLAALARPGEEVARTAITAVHGLLGEDSLAEERADLFLDLVLSALPEAMRAVEASMLKWDYLSDFAKRFVAQGEAKGWAAGKAEGMRDALLRVLQRRGFALSPDLQRRVDMEPSVERLERWLDLAVTTQSVADVFADAY